MAGLLAATATLTAAVPRGVDRGGVDEVDQ
jgi:hypothetical protein